MGTFNKFKESGTLYSDNSGRRIEKMNIGAINGYQSYLDVLEKYFETYGIDLFDKENIENFISIYDLKFRFRITSNDVVTDLKSIMKKSSTYINNYESYIKALENYYKIHRDRTILLAKLFVERNELERFDLTPEDVVDDLNKMMTTTPQIANPYQPQNSTCLDRINATMDFTQGYYFDVITMLKDASPTDFKVIVLTSQSHLAVGNFVSAYNILKVLFESNEPIYQLPYTDKKKSFPLGYEIFEILKNLRINIWSDALKREKLFPIIPTELGKIKNMRHNEFGENCYYQISELSADIDKISIKECVDALVKAEMTFELSWNIDKSHYQLKAMYLDRLLSYFSDKPVDDVMELWVKGSAECLRMAELQ